MKIVSHTVVYKTIADTELEIELDIHYPEHDKGQPVLLFFHGNGSPVQGSRSDIPDEILGVVGKSNWALVCADHRLAPQAGINDIYEDVKDCFEFIRDPQGLSSFLPNGTIDPERVAVAGSEGGGYLALLAGLHVDPKPQAVIALNPITNPFSKGNGNLPELLGLEGRKNPENDKWSISQQLKVSARTPPHDSALPPTFLVHEWDNKQVSVGQSDGVAATLKQILGKKKYEEYNQFERLKGWEHASDDEKSEFLDRVHKFVQLWM